MSGGSQQLRRFRIAHRAGVPVADAERLAGILAGEGADALKRDAIDPPGEDAFRPINHGFCAACARHLCACSDLEWLGLVDRGEASGGGHFDFSRMPEERDHG